MNTNPTPEIRLTGKAGAILAVFLMACGLLGEPALAQARVSKEYKLKATFLLNFARFVEWPPDTWASAEAPLTIGVLGDDDFGPFLDQIVHGEKIGNRPLIVRRSRTVEGLKGCNILFVSKSEEARLGTVLMALGQSTVLTVGEVEGFARRGGVINFYLDGERLRFEINADAAVRCGLKISSQLLSLGKLVGTADSKEHR